MKQPITTTIPATYLAIFFAITIVVGCVILSLSRLTWYCGSDEMPRTVKATLKNGVLKIRGKGPMMDYVEMTDDFIESGESDVEMTDDFIESRASDADVKDDRANYWTPWRFAVKYGSTISITDVVIENGVTHIGDWAFARLPDLTSITISASVSSIGDEALVGCGIELYDDCGCDSSLTSITVAENNAYYSSENGVLFNKNKTTLIKYPTGRRQNTYMIPNSVTTIEKLAFYGCKNLTSVTIPSNVTSIGERAFAYTGLTSVIIPNSVTFIGESAFSDCVNLMSVVMSNSITSIEKQTFFYCKNLTSVIIPNNVTSIRESAFGSCKNLTSVTIPNSVTSIEDLSFENCTNLISITIPNSVTSIGGGIFIKCTNLISVTCLNPNPSNIIGWFHHPTACLYVPKGSVDAYRNADGWKIFECIKPITVVGDT